MQGTQALYRTWRPQRFSDVVGQEAVLTTLRNQIASGRVAHAYLFSGTRGTGKTTIAKIMARAVNCQDPQDGEPCGGCKACEALAAENNLDVVEIDAASNNGVDDIRDLREKVKYPPQHGRFRVYIVDEVHMLSQGAFNALLKTLEEPPAHVVFILATTEPQKLPATILSRCLRFDFHRIALTGIVGRLRQVTEALGVEAEEDALLTIARAAEGALRDGLSILDMCLAYGGKTLTAQQVRGALGAADPARMFALVQAFLEGDAGEALRAGDLMMGQGMEAQRLARNLTEHIRGLLLALNCGEDLAELMSITPEQAKEYQDQARKGSAVNLLRLLDLFLAAETDMKWASQPRYALEGALVRACLPEEALQLDQLTARVDQLEKKIAQGAAITSHAGAMAAMAGGRPAGTASSEGKAPVPPAKAAPAATPAPGGSDASLWAEVLKKLARIQPGLHAALKQGSFEGIQGDVARISYGPAVALFVSMVSAPEKIQMVEEALAQVFQRPLRLQVGTPSPAAAKEAPREEGDALQRAFEIFGRENVQVMENE